MPRGQKRLTNILDAYAEKQVAKLGKDGILAHLREQGISSLEDLVARELADFKNGGEVAKTTFIYEQFVYKAERVIDDVLLDEIEAKIKNI